MPLAGGDGRLWALVTPVKAIMVGVGVYKKIKLGKVYRVSLHGLSLRAHQTSL